MTTYSVAFECDLSANVQSQMKEIIKFMYHWPAKTKTHKWKKQIKIISVSQ